MEGVGRVLVVDDDVRWGQVVARLLRTYGFDPTVCFHADAALRALERGTWSLLIYDYDLGSMTGASLAVRTRAQLGAACPPVALLTSDLDAVPDEDRWPFDATLSKGDPPRAVVEELQALALDATEVSESHIRARDALLGDVLLGERAKRAGADRD